MMASILSMTLCLQIVAFFAVQREVHAVRLLARLHPERSHETGDLQRQEAAQYGEAYADQSADQLIDDLTWISVHQTETRSAGEFDRGIHHARGEDACHQAAGKTANAVHAESVKGIVIPQPL